MASLWPLHAQPPAEDSAASSWESPAPFVFPSLESGMDAEHFDRLAPFRAKYSEEWQVVWDRRNDRPHRIQGVGITLFAPTARPTLDQVERKLRQLLAEDLAFLVDEGVELELDLRRSTRENPVLAGEIVLRQVHRGIPVEEAYLYFRLRAGRLVQFGNHRVAPVDASRLTDLAPEEEKEDLARALRAAEVFDVDATQTRSEIVWQALPAEPEFAANYTPLATWLVAREGEPKGDARTEKSWLRLAAPAGEVLAGGQSGEMRSTLCPTSASARRLTAQLLQRFGMPTAVAEQAESEACWQATASDNLPVCGANAGLSLFAWLDDRDGNLANGTPNLCQAWDAFAAASLACGERPACHPEEPSSADTSDLAEVDPAGAGLLESASGASTEAGPAYWQFPYNPPGVATFTGAATYSYGFELPPGFGGLQPELALNYSSRAVDSLRFPVMGRGFGLGWSLPQPEIVNGNTWKMYQGNPNCCASFDPNKFSLVLGGVTYQLKPGPTLPGSSRYRHFTALGDPSLQVSYLGDLSAPNTTGEYWEVRTADGRLYRFGYQADAEQVVPVYGVQNSGQIRNPGWSAASWKLDTVTNVDGHQLRYVYGTWSTGSPTREADVALTEIQYNFDGNGIAQTKVTFSYHHQNHQAGGLDHYMTVGYFRPSQLVIRHANAVVSAFTFSYEAFDHYVSADGFGIFFWWLKDLTAYGSDFVEPGNPSLALPKTNFFYAQETLGCATNPDGITRCAKLLDRVDNGYGGVTRFLYQAYNREGQAVSAPRDFHAVKETYRWDGVRHIFNNDNNSAAARETFAASNPCYEKINTGCAGLDPEHSGTLVGFGAVRQDHQTFAGTWSTLASTDEVFDISNYWLNGKTLQRRQLEPANAFAEKVRESFTWHVTPTGQTQLLERTTHLEGATAFFTKETYTYEGEDASHFGALSQSVTYDQDGTPYRCTAREYTHQVVRDAQTRVLTWLVNHPIRITHHAGACGGTKLSETLMRYDGSTSPADTSLEGKGKLERTLEWVGATSSDTRYQTSRIAYGSHGLPLVNYRYSDYSTTSAYATDVRSTETVLGYNVVGLPLGRSRAGLNGVPATQVETTSYETARPWLPVTSTSASGETTAYAYDRFGRLLKLARPGDSLSQPSETYTYWDDGTVAGGIRFVAPLLVNTAYRGGLRSELRELYDGFGRLVQTQDTRAAIGHPAVEQDVILTTAYDALGRVACRTQPYGVAPYVWDATNPFETAACTSQTHEVRQYDALGRVRSVIAPGSLKTTYHYGVMTLGARTYQYADVTDPNRRRTQQVDDAWGRKAVVYEIAGDCGNYWSNEGYGCGPAGVPWSVYSTTQYSYDRRDRLVQVTDHAGNSSTMTYDALGRRLTSSDPDLGTWTFAYDAIGNLVSQTQPRGETLTFFYDRFDRMTSKRQGATVLASFEYDSGNHAAGRLSRAFDASGSHQIVYDDEGRVASETRSIGAFAYTRSFSYDLLGRVQQMVLPNGEAVTTTYNAQGLPTSASGWSSYASGLGYNARGQRVRAALGNGLESLAGYDATTGRLGTLVTGSLQNLSYSYDPAGNVTQVVDGANSGQIESFWYDHRHRLVAAGTNAVGLGQYDHTGPRGYSYDELGNLLGVDQQTYQYSGWAAACGANLPSQSLPHAVRQVGSNRFFCYDANGNMTQRIEGATTYTQIWGPENRLASVTVAGKTTTFAYDANGQRLSTTLPDQGGVIHEPFEGYQVNQPGQIGSTQRTTYWLAGQAVAVRERGLALLETFDDQNASGWTVVDGTWSMSHGAEGSRYRQTNTTDNATHSVRALAQAGAMAFEWEVSFETGVNAAGLHLFASAATGEHQGNSYLVWQNSTEMLLYESQADVLTLRANASAPNAAGQTHRFKATYDPADGQLKVWRNGTLILQWTDPSPLASGAYVALRTNKSGVSFDDLRITGDLATWSKVHYPLADHLGSTQTTSDQNGALVDRARYLPFGSYRQGDRSLISQHGFTGQRHEDDLGLIYMNARYYVPGIGRFASADTVVASPGNPQNLNRFSYVENRPTRLTDPSGHSSVDRAEVPNKESWKRNDKRYGRSRVGQRGPARTAAEETPTAVELQKASQPAASPNLATTGGFYGTAGASVVNGVAKEPLASFANNFGVFLSLFSFVSNQLTIFEKQTAGILTPEQVVEQTAANGVVNGAAIGLGGWGFAHGTGAVVTATGAPAAVGTATVVVGTVSLAYVGSVWYQTSVNMSEGMSFTPALYTARADIHDQIVPGGNAAVDAALNAYVLPVMQAAGDAFVNFVNWVQDEGCH